MKQTDSCKPLHLKLKLLTVPCLYIFEVSIFVKANKNLFQYRTRERHRDKLRIVASKTTLMNQSIFCKAVHIFNRILIDIRIADDLDKFKKKLHELLAQKCYYSIEDYLSDKL